LSFLHQRFIQQTLDIRLIRKPFGSGKLVGDNQVNGTQPDTDMSRLKSCEQTTNGAIPLRIRDLGNVAEVDFFIRHCSEGVEFLFLFLSWRNVSVPMDLLFVPG
jgi:hypothetical protein